MQKIKLSDGNKMPSIGLGLWKVKDKKQFDQTFKTALGDGYTHFDSAQAYGNEQFLGKAWRESGVNREDIFITTKILVQNFGYKKTIKSFEDSLNKLQTSYVDLVLLHFPSLPWLRKSNWQALEKIKSGGKAKSIGVSNYSVRQLKAMKSYATEMPAVNQIEVHLFHQQQEIRDYCRGQHIQVEAYSPLAHARLMNEPLIQQIARKHNKSYAQIMIRWCIDQGTVPLPKSTTPQRIKENIDVFDFTLDAEDLRQLNTLDRKFRTLWHSIIFG